MTGLLITLCVAPYKVMILVKTNVQKRVNDGHSLFAQQWPGRLTSIQMFTRMRELLLKRKLGGL